MEARAAAALGAAGPDAARTLEFARRFATHHRIDLPLHFTVHRAIPAHAGLGSGTQLGLAVARPAPELSGLPVVASTHPPAVGRRQRAGERAGGACAAGEGRAP